MSRRQTFSGKGNKSIGRVTHSGPGMVWMQVNRKNEGNVVVSFHLPNGSLKKLECVNPSYKFEDREAYFPIGLDDHSFDLDIIASPATDWVVSTWITSAESGDDSVDSPGERRVVQAPTPDYVCVNLAKGENLHVNVRSGPGFSRYDLVAGGDRDHGGGAIPGTRYKVVQTELNGEAVSGQVNGRSETTTVWHEIEFNGKSGWVTEFYVDPC